jgi:hypothetical protein
MSLQVKTTGSIPTRVWDEQAMQQLAVRIRGDIVYRSQVEGLDVRDAPFSAYSDQPITVSFGSETARRLAPKGGSPAYGRGHPRRLIKNGRAPIGRGWTITGRHYADGYGQYKSESRRGLVSKSGRSGTLVDLTLSGDMFRSFRVLRHSRYSAVIGLTGAPRVYGPEVDQRRQWIGLSPGNLAMAQDEASSLVVEVMERSASRVTR